MEWSYGNFLALFAFVFLGALAVLLKQRRSRHDAKKRPPPGPPAWPGNIFDLGDTPHQKLYKLRFKYGPLLWLKLGCVNTLVVQSARAAEELFKKH